MKFDRAISVDFYLFGVCLSWNPNASSAFEEKENGILFFSTGSESCQHIAAHGISTAWSCSQAS
jgi:hypothetical protein